MHAFNEFANQPVSQGQNFSLANHIGENFASNILKSI